MPATTMKAFYVAAPGNFGLADRPRPEPGPDDALNPPPRGPDAPPPEIKFPIIRCVRVVSG